MSVIYVLWLRELKRYVRSRVQIVASLGQPMLYLLALEHFQIKHRLSSHVSTVAVAGGGLLRN